MVVELLEYNFVELILEFLQIVPLEFDMGPIWFLDFLFAQLALCFLLKYNIFESSIWTQLIDSQKKKKKEQLIIAHKAKNVVTQLETQGLNFFIPIYWIIKKKKSTTY